MKLTALKVRSFKIHCRNHDLGYSSTADMEAVTVVTVCWSILFFFMLT